MSDTETAPANPAPIPAATPLPPPPLDLEALRNDIKALIDQEVTAQLADHVAKASGALAPIAAGVQQDGARPVRPVLSHDLQDLANYVDALDAYRHGG